MTGADNQGHAVAQGPDTDVYRDNPHAVQVKVEHDLPHAIAVEWEWEGMDGVQLLAPVANEPPVLIIRITDLGDHL